MVKDTSPAPQGEWHTSCAAILVKKAGPTFGRTFHVRAQAQGPASNPEDNCGHLKWASSKSKPK